MALELAISNDRTPGCRFAEEARLSELGIAALVAVVRDTDPVVSGRSPGNCLAAGHTSALAGQLVESGNHC